MVRRVAVNHAIKVRILASELHNTIGPTQSCHMWCNDRQLYEYNHEDNTNVNAISALGVK